MDGVVSSTGTRRTEKDMTARERILISRLIRYLDRHWLPAAQLEVVRELVELIREAPQHDSHVIAWKGMQT
jgi:hypothetical protein